MGRAVSDPQNLATSVDAVELAALVEQWLPEQRWFAGKQRPVETVTVVSLGPIGPDGFQIEIWLATVHYLDGESELYQVPLHLSTIEHQSFARAELGELRDDGDRPVHVYDAMAGKHLPQAWLQGLVDEIVDETDSGGVQFHRLADPADIPLGTTSLLLSGEQSNTSAVFGDRAILKVFRRLEVGINPDVEIHEALERTGGSHIARLLGHVSGDLHQAVGNFAFVAARAENGSDGWSTRISLAMLQNFLSSATDGWELAKTSVRDLMAEADLHAQEAGGDFAAEAFRLGRATAEVHAALVEAFGCEQLGGQQLRERADAMLTRLDAAIVVVPELAEVAEQLREYYEALAGAQAMSVQRIHGDLHLGQVLRTVNRWVLLDFEGEPVKSIRERRQLDSPLRDVAAMMRSFDYAANHQVIDSVADSQQAYRAVEWAERNRDAFCTGYAGAGTDPRSELAVLRAFEADKAVYEAVYEARNRPLWLPVPLASLSRLAGAGGKGATMAHRPPDESAEQTAADREDA